MVLPVAELRQQSCLTGVETMKLCSGPFAKSVGSTEFKAVGRAVRCNDLLPLDGVSLRDVSDDIRRASAGSSVCDHFASGWEVSYIAAGFALHIVSRSCELQFQVCRLSQAQIAFNKSLGS
jgi:hypothetical protein